MRRLKPLIPATSSYVCKYVPNWCVAAALILFTAATGAQVKAQALSAAGCSSGISGQTPSAGQRTLDYDRPVSWKLLLPNILCDQKRIWLFPARLAQDGNWIATVSVVGATAGLATLDPTEGSYFHQTSAFQGFNGIFTSDATVIGTILAPSSLYVAGLLRRDAKMEHTALLAGEAVADSEIVTEVLKYAGGRARPATFKPGENYWDSWFERKSTGSFPSGHTIAAFSIATVIARRYSRHRWLPYLAYGLAGAVGFSRLTLSAHFASDVFFGAAAGYCISRFAVLQQ